MKNRLIGKDPFTGKDWRQEEKGTTEDEMVGWHHRLNGHEFWVHFGNWWWTGRPGVLQSMELQRVGHDWVTELNWTELFTAQMLQKSRKRSNLGKNIRIKFRDSLLIIFKICNMIRAHIIAKVRNNAK